MDIKPLLHMMDIIQTPTKSFPNANFHAVPNVPVGKQESSYILQTQNSYKALSAIKESDNEENSNIDLCAR